MSAVLEPGIPAHSRAAIRPFFWSVRRELWENRFIFIAPAAIAVLVVGAYLVGTVQLPEIIVSNPHMMSGTPPPPGLPFSFAAMAVLLTGILAGAYYSLGALYGERRDRSILFWKSLPLSDRTVVLAKAVIPLAVLPAFCFLLILAMQGAMLTIGTVSMLRAGGLPVFWTSWPFLKMAVVMLYCFVALALWHAPLYGWLFLVSAWAKRGPFLWAVLPPLAICVAEKVAFNSSLLFSLIMDRLAGAFNAAFNSLGGTAVPISLDQLAPLKFLATPDLWLGLLVAVGFFVGAIRLRRFQGPL